MIPVKNVEIVDYLGLRVTTTEHFKEFSKHCDTEEVYPWTLLNKKLVTNRSTTDISIRIRLTKCVLVW